MVCLILKTLITIEWTNSLLRRKSVSKLKTWNFMLCCQRYKNKCLVCTYKLVCDTNRSFESSLSLFLMFGTQVTNQLEIIEGKNVLVRNISRYPSVVPLNMFSIALASVKSESYQQLLKICRRDKHCSNLYVYLQSVCVKSQETWVFWSPLVSANC